MNRVVQLPKPVAYSLESIGVTPVRCKPNKWWLIMDLSSPGVPVLRMKLTRKCAAYLTPQLIQLLKKKKKTLFRQE